jgi:acetolactate synthase-1/2/3 large subunit
MKNLKKNREVDGAALLVDCLEAHEVKYVFGVPGASLMPVLDVLADRGPKFVVCRHEQNAAFMAAAWGRLTGRPGVCLATVGPGATNLVTGCATATADRDPMVAITGQTPRAHLFQNRHQNIDAAALFRPVTKWSVEAEEALAIPEIMATAFSTALSPRPGATHVALPTDVLEEETRSRPMVRDTQPAPEAKWTAVRRAVAILKASKRPVILIGVGASETRSARAVRDFMAVTGIPAACTFEGAGVVGRSLLGQFLGRVGLAADEPGDRALGEADAVLTIGYDVVEYAPSYWHTAARIIHIDRLSADVDAEYAPDVELLGDVAATLMRLSQAIGPHHFDLTGVEKGVVKTITREQRRAVKASGRGIHPARLVAEIRKAMGDRDLVISDVGAHQVWLAREYLTYEPRTLMFSMGFQTMGVALPWAMAARLADKKRKIISCSGDGSFMMSAMELETAVRLKLPFVHVIWRDGTYNLVEIQQQVAYGRVFGTKFGNPDFVDLANSFGALAMRVSSASALAPTLDRALRVDRPVIIDVPVDYRHNVGLLGKGDLFV